MKFLPFIVRHLRRSWMRTITTAAAIAVCIFLFCTLQTFVASLTGFLKQGTGRLITRANVSLAVRMPLAYEAEIAAVPGVKRVAVANWFGGMRDLSKPLDVFTNFAIEADNFLVIYPEYILPDAEKQAFLRDQRGCIVGRALAEKFNWKVGDAVGLESSVPDYRTAKPLEFVIRAVYRTDQVRYPGTNEALFFFHYKYLDEATGRKAGVYTYRVEISDTRQEGKISKAIDNLFENSDPQTHTETEAQYRASVGILGGNLALLLNGIALAVIFTILLVTANTMSMAVRERRTEIGVLKTLGFQSRLVMLLVLSEGGILGAIGAVTGLMIGRLLIVALPKAPLIGELIQSFPRLSVPPVIAIGGLAIGTLLGVTAGLIPAVLAYRSTITELLRQT